MTRALFVTGAGTGVGKTHVSAGLVGAWRSVGRAVVALKPVLSGFDPADPDHDAARLARAAGLDPADAAILDRMAPFRFAAPLSPDMAARREGRTIPFDALVAHGRDAIASAPPGAVVLIEGVGGAMVPLDDSHTVRDWIAALGIPAVLVGGTYLGAISHVLTAAACLATAGVTRAAIVLSESACAEVDAAETLATVARHAGGVPVHLVRRAAPGGTPDPDLRRLAAWLGAD